ncbi:MAG: Mu transposase C-terminal domain-containing protein, partial [Desulfobacterales bacterium]|nr:Mu transposase C-terminal domain-containing protein [Desulfobacterales bacterium]
MDSDYIRKEHSAIKKSPLDFFLSQADNINFVPSKQKLDELFLVSVKRKVNHDGTLQINKNLYETDICLAKKSVEVRYEPEWLSDPSFPLFIFDDNGQKVAEAQFVNLSDNCKVRRKGQY